MKNRSLHVNATLLLLLLVVGFVSANWQKIELEFSHSVVCDIEMLEDYQFITLFGEKKVYRREVFSDTWELVADIESDSKKTPTLSRFNGMLYFYDYVSRDSGTTWKRDTTIDYCPFYQWGDNIVRITDSGVAVSTDSGENWSNQSQKQTSVYSLYRKADLSYACGWGSIYISSDDGVSWDTVSNGLPERTEIYSMIALNDTLLVASTGKGIYKSGTAGSEWDLLDSSFSNITGTTFKKFYSFQDKVYALSEQYIYTFSISDNSFNKLEIPLAKGIRAEDILGFDNTLYVTGLNGVLKYDLGEDSWDLLDKGLESGTFKSGYVDYCFSSNKVVAEVTTRSSQSMIFLSTNLGDTWKHVLTTQAGVANMNILGDSIILGHRLSSESKTYISSDNGATWEENNVPNNPLLRRDLKYIDDTLYAIESAVSRSADGGNTWEEIDNNFITPSFFKEGDDMILLAVYYKPRTSVVKVSRDNGKSFITLTEPLSKAIGTLRYNGQEIVTISIDSDEKRHIVVTEDFGNTWYQREIASALNPTHIEGYWNDILIGSIWGQNGITSYCYSKTGGVYWNPIDVPEGIEENYSNMPAVIDDYLVLMEANRLQVCPLEGMVETSVISNGSFNNTQSLTVSATAKALKLGITVNNTQKGVFSIFSMNGRQMHCEELELKSGANTVTINNNSLASGAYVARFSSLDKSMNMSKTIRIP